MHDTRDRLVGSSIYFWKVILAFESGKIEKFTDKMGVMWVPESCN